MRSRASSRSTRMCSRSPSSCPTRVDRARTISSALASLPRSTLIVRPLSERRASRSRRSSSSPSIFRRAAARASSRPRILSRASDNSASSASCSTRGTVSSGLNWVAKNARRTRMTKRNETVRSVIDTKTDSPSSSTCRRRTPAIAIEIYSFWRGVNGSAWAITASNRLSAFPNSSFSFRSNAPISSTLDRTADSIFPNASPRLWSISR